MSYYTFIGENYTAEIIVSNESDAIRILRKYTESLNDDDEWETFTRT